MRKWNSDSFLSIGLLALLALSIPVGIVLFMLGLGIDIFLVHFRSIKRSAGWFGRPQIRPLCCNSFFYPTRRNSSQIGHCETDL